MNYNLTQYTYHFVSAYALMSIYDQAVESKQFTSQYVMYDSASFGLTAVISLMLKDVVEQILPSVPGSFQQMLYRPLFHGLIYMYLYKMMVQPMEGSGIYRSNKMNFAVGFIADVLIKYIENPLVGLFTGIGTL